MSATMQETKIEKLRQKLGLSKAEMREVLNRSIEGYERLANDEKELTFLDCLMIRKYYGDEIVRNYLT